MIQGWEGTPGGLQPELLLLLVSPLLAQGQVSCGFVHSSVENLQGQSSLSERLFA